MTVLKFAKGYAPTLAECVRVAGEVVAGNLLYRVAILAARPDVFWIAKTRPEWMAETGLTLEQYKRATKVLRNKALITVKIMLKQGKPTTHVRLGAKAPNVWCKTHQTDRLNKYLNTEVIKELTVIAPKTAQSEILSTSEDVGVKEAVPEIAVPEQIKVPEVEVASTGWLVKATDILKHHQGKVAGSLETHWKSRMALVYSGYQKPLTGKQVGQLKQLSKYLGNQTKPVIDYVIEHWWKFASRAGAMAGKSFPSEPDIGYLLLHHAVAVNLLIEKEALPVKPKVAEPEPVQLVAAGADEEPVKTLTPQELAELIDGLKSP